MNKNEIQFEINNFRNIVNTISLSIYPDKLNLIVGDNNIGKSNVLSSLNLMDLNTSNNNNKYHWSTDIPMCLSNPTALLETYASITYELPKDYLSKKFEPCLTADEYKKYSDKFITDFTFINKSNGKSDGLISAYTKLIDNETCTINSDKIQKVLKELIQDTYPQFYKIDGDENLENVTFNFSYKDLLDCNNKTFFDLHIFLCSFAQLDQVTKWEQILKFIKTPIENGLSENELGVKQTEINKQKQQFLSEINSNIYNLYKNFKNLHCKLKIDFTPTNDIKLFIDPMHEKRKYASIIYKTQGKGVRKLIKLICLLQYLKNQTEIKHIVLIDEIEESLSANSQLALVNFLKQYVKNNTNVYIVCVTHSCVFFEKSKKDKYSDYMYLNVCSQKEDGTLASELVDPDPIIDEQTGYQFMNGEEATDGIEFLNKVLDKYSKY